MEDGQPNDAATLVPPMMDAMGSHQFGQYSIRGMHGFVHGNDRATGEVSCARYALPWQQRFVEQCLARYSAGTPGYINAIAMGLGKTIASVAAGLAILDKHVPLPRFFTPSRDAVSDETQRAILEMMIRHKAHQCHTEGQCHPAVPDGIYSDDAVDGWVERAWFHLCLGRFNAPELYDINLEPALLDHAGLEKLWHQRHARALSGQSRNVSTSSLMTIPPDLDIVLPCMDDRGQMHSLTGAPRQRCRAPILIVCGCPFASEWLSTFEMMTPGSVRVLNLIVDSNGRFPNMRKQLNARVGPNALLDLIAEERYDFVIVSYGVLGKAYSYMYHSRGRESGSRSTGRPRKDGSMGLGGTGTVDHNLMALMRIVWSVVIVDEAHSVSNAKSTRHRALANTKSYFKVFITGTPVQNSINDVRSLLLALNFDHAVLREDTFRHICDMRYSVQCIRMRRQYIMERVCALYNRDRDVLYARWRRAYTRWVRMIHNECVTPHHHQSTPAGSEPCPLTASDGTTETFQAFCNRQRRAYLTNAAITTCREISRDESRAFLSHSHAEQRRIVSAMAALSSPWPMRRLFVLIMRLRRDSTTGELSTDTFMDGQYQRHQRQEQQRYDVAAFDEDDNTELIHGVLASDVIPNDVFWAERNGYHDVRRAPPLSQSRRSTTLAPTPHIAYTYSDGSPMDPLIHLMRFFFHWEDTNAARTYLSERAASRDPHHRRSVKAASGGDGDTGDDCSAYRQAIKHTTIWSPFLYDHERRLYVSVCQTTLRFMHQLNCAGIDTGRNQAPSASSGGSRTADSTSTHPTTGTATSETIPAWCARFNLVDQLADIESLTTSESERAGVQAFVASIIEFYEWDDGETSTHTPMPASTSITVPVEPLPTPVPSAETPPLFASRRKDSGRDRMTNHMLSREHAAVGIAGNGNYNNDGVHLDGLIDRISPVTDAPARRLPAWMNIRLNVDRHRRRSTQPCPQQPYRNQPAASNTLLARMVTGKTCKGDNGGCGGDGGDDVYEDDHVEQTTHGFSDADRLDYHMAFGSGPAAAASGGVASNKHAPLEDMASSVRVAILRMRQVCMHPAFVFIPSGENQSSSLTTVRNMIYTRSRIGHTVLDAIAESKLSQPNGSAYGERALHLPESIRSAIAGLHDNDGDMIWHPDGLFDNDDAELSAAYHQRSHRPCAQRAIAMVEQDAQAIQRRLLLPYSAFTHTLDDRRQYVRPGTKETMLYRLFRNELPEALADGDPARIITPQHKILVFDDNPAVQMFNQRAADAAFGPYTSVCISGEIKRHATRVRMIERFRTDPSIRVLFMTLGTGAHGFNIPEVDIVVFPQPWWTPEKENQAVARALRISRQRPVFVYHLAIVGTIEEHVCARQQEKRRMLHALEAYDEPMTQMFANSRHFRMLCQLGDRSNCTSPDSPDSPGSPVSPEPAAGVAASASTPGGAADLDPREMAQMASGILSTHTHIVFQLAQSGAALMRPEDRLSPTGATSACTYDGVELDDNDKDIADMLVDCSEIMSDSSSNSGADAVEGDTSSDTDGLDGHQDVVLHKLTVDDEPCSPPWSPPLPTESPVLARTVGRKRQRDSGATGTPKTAARSLLHRRWHHPKSCTIVADEASHHGGSVSGRTAIKISHERRKRRHIDLI